MLNLRRLVTAALCAAAVMTGCGTDEHAGMTPDVRRELVAGREAIDAWIAESHTSPPTDEAVIGLGYAERLRLGLGSPFRLVEEALRDPRLSEEVRRQVAWGLLSRTLSRDAYEIDGAALDRAGVGSVSSWPGLGHHHLELIDDAITEARDPRSGELAVRIAYRLAAMEGSLPAHAPKYATNAAAMVRDRELARTDVIRLLRSAEAVQRDPLTAVRQWRSDRLLHVEAPLMSALPADSEREALELAPHLAQALRTLGARVGDVTSIRRDAADVRPSLLTHDVAVRLAQLADSLKMPPQAPVSIAARMYTAELTMVPWLSPEERVRREAFTAIADAEQYAAAHAQLVRSSPHDAAPSLSAVWAAVALRPFAQQPVWFPGFGGPGPRELEERFGLASLRFDDEVPPEWRPFYRGMLERSLQDMQRVLPALDTRGLAIRFGRVRQREGTLAMHDPKARRLVLPPGSVAGTIAHEVAHDLDWQVALRRYNVRGDYASDFAARTRGDRLAVHVSSLAPRSVMEAELSERSLAHARRPAENFARAVDWFVASALAADGRMNGYLSSVQDPVITGYGTVRPPDLSGRAGDALINILDEVAPLYPATRAEFLRKYGSGRIYTAFDLIRGIMEVELPKSADARSGMAGAEHDDLAGAFSAIGAARARGFNVIDDWMCRSPAGAYDRALEQALRTTVVEAAEARARGVAVQHARRMHGDAAARWVTRRFYGGPWPVQELDDGMEELLEEIVAAAKAVGSVELSAHHDGFQLQTRPAHCAGLAVTAGTG